MEIQPILDKCRFKKILWLKWRVNAHCPVQSAEASWTQMNTVWYTQAKAVGTAAQLSGTDAASEPCEVCFYESISAFTA